MAGLRSSLPSRIRFNRPHWRQVARATLTALNRPLIRQGLRLRAGC